MQRISFFVLGLLTLYVSNNALATPPAPNLNRSETLSQPSPTPSAFDVATPTPMQDEPASPHIALILPLKASNAELAQAAAMLKQGFQVAAEVQPALPVRIYACGDEVLEGLALYRQALINGAVAVAGPLTRSGVTALTHRADIPVPTLVLNVIEDTSPTANLYYFGLLVEQEAKQSAQLASMAHLKYATIISSGSVLSKRMVAAFSAEWKRLGGTITAEVQFKNNHLDEIAHLPVAPWPAGERPKPQVIISETGEKIAPARPLPPAVAPGNMVFLATDSASARLIRPYLNPSLPVYATSQLFQGNAKKLLNYDLTDINFVEMPWFLQTDNAAVTNYPRLAVTVEPDMERLYAFGIDAYRLLNVLLHRHLNTELPLDGVTGQVRLQQHQFVRNLTPGFFKLGLGLTQESYEVLKAAKLPASAVSTTH